MTTVNVFKVPIAIQPINENLLTAEDHGGGGGSPELQSHAFCFAPAAAYCQYTCKNVFVGHEEDLSF